MSCVHHTTGQMQCEAYDSMLVSPTALQAARALIISANIYGLFGILFGVFGDNCRNSVLNKRRKNKGAIASGVVFIIAGVLMLIPIAGTTSNLFNTFYNPTSISGHRRKLGLSLYIGWCSTGLLFLGGSFLCCFCFCKNKIDSEVSFFSSCPCINEMDFEVELDCFDF